MKMNIEKNQIWVEVDPRFSRHVMVLDVKDGRRGIAVRTCEMNASGEWTFPIRSRSAWCDRERFNRKRGGYAFIGVATIPTEGEP